jgi:hypothetical protein
MLEVIPTCYTLCIWYGRLPGNNTGDWFGYVKQKDGEPMKIEYRFRYYNSPDAFDGKDEKNWYSGIVKPGTSEDVILADVKTLVDMVSSRLGVKTELVVVKARGEKVLEHLQNRDWFHMKVATPEEAKHYGFEP